jgi:RNA-binding protein 39
MRFENMQGAVNAQRALHGRWFAGKMITATFMVIIQFLTILVISFVDATYAAKQILLTCRFPRPTRPSFLTAHRIRSV